MKITSSGIELDGNESLSEGEAIIESTDSGLQITVSGGETYTLSNNISATSPSFDDLRIGDTPVETNAEGNIKNVTQAKSFAGNNVASVDNSNYRELLVDLQANAAQQEFEQGLNMLDFDSGMYDSFHTLSKVTPNPTIAAPDGKLYASPLRVSEKFTSSFDTGDDTEIVLFTGGGDYVFVSAYSTKNQAKIFSTSTGEELWSRTADSITNAASSPAGSVLAYQEYDGSSHTGQFLNIDPSTDTVSREQFRSGEVEDSVFSSDGNSLYFYSDNSGEDVYKYNVSSSGLNQDWSESPSKPIQGIVGASNSAVAFTTEDNENVTFHIERSSGGTIHSHDVSGFGYVDSLNQSLSWAGTDKMLVLGGDYGNYVSAIVDGTSVYEIHGSEFPTNANGTTEYGHLQWVDVDNTFIYQDESDSWWEVDATSIGTDPDFRNWNRTKLDSFPDVEASISGYQQGDFRRGISYPGSSYLLMEDGGPVILDSENYEIVEQTDDHQTYNMYESSDGSTGTWVTGQNGNYTAYEIGQPNSETATTPNIDVGVVPNNIILSDRVTLNGGNIEYTIVDADGNSLNITRSDVGEEKQVSFTSSLMSLEIEFSLSGSLQPKLSSYAIYVSE